MSFSPCCITGFKWDGKPAGRIGKLADIDTYIAGDNPDVAILLIHDLLGWTFQNSRLLADHYAEEVGATVYLPDFCDGEVVSPEPVLAERYAEIQSELIAWGERNARVIREPSIFAFARALRATAGHKAVAAVGYCWGGWGVFRLGAGEHDPPLVDCITAGHPSWLVPDDIDAVRVPTQLLAPENDVMFPPDLKNLAFTKLRENGVELDYQHLPGVEHSCFIRGDLKKPGERAAMVRGKNAAVGWMKHWLYLEKA
ncbi:dienelactone hydrolase [Thozetella sp. PMI_491]|nr:dienelactone hydrolase [Thozetella sp. PMI_491]